MSQLLEKSGLAATLRVDTLPATVSGHYVSVGFGFPQFGQYQFRVKATYLFVNFWTLKLEEVWAGGATVLAEENVLVKAGGAIGVVAGPIYSGRVSMWALEEGGGEWAEVASAEPEGSLFGFLDEIENAIVIEAEGSGGRYTDAAFDVLELEPLVTTQAASSTDRFSGTLNGEVDPNGLATTYWFEYGETESYGSATEKVEGLEEAKAVAAALKGLKQGTTYHFRLVAENSAGKSVGEDKSFETDPPLELVQPRDKPDLALDVEVETPTGFHRLASDDPDPAKRPTDLSFSTQRGDGFGPARCKLTRSILREWADIEVLDTWRFISKADEIAYEGKLHSAPKTDDPQPSFDITLVGWMTYLASRKMGLIGIESRLSSWQDPSNARKAKRVAENRQYNLGVTQGWQGNGENPPGITFDHTSAERAEGKTNVGESWFFGGGEDIGALLYHFARLVGAEGESHYNSVAYLSNDDLLASNDTGTDHNGATNANPYETLEATEPGRKYAAIKDEREEPGGGGSPVTTLDSWEYPKVIGDHGLELVGSWPEVGFRLTDLIKYILAAYYPKIVWAGEDNEFVVQQATWHDNPATGYDAIQQLDNLVLWETSVWEERKFHFHRADLSRIDWQIRTDDPDVTVVFQGDSIETFANGIQVTYTDFDGITRVLYPDEYEELRDESPENPANLHGEDLWTEFAAPFPCSLVEALQFGRTYLIEYNRPKRPGTFKISGGYIKDGAGHWRQGWRPRSSETLGVMDLIGDAPRLIFATNWNQNDKTLDITVDAPPKDIEAQVARQELARQAQALA